MLGLLTRFTRGHYQRMAEQILQQRHHCPESDHELDEFTKRLADMLEANNRNFDRRSFYRASWFTGEVP